jgi:hypothetical protein
VAGFADIDGIPGAGRGGRHRPAPLVGHHQPERGAKLAFPFLVVELENVVVTRMNASWSGGMPDEEVSLGFGKVCWEYRRSPAASPVRFCFDLRSGSPA